MLLPTLAGFKFKFWHQPTSQPKIAAYDLFRIYNKLAMKVLIVEIFWQHTEVLGTWIDYFSRRGDSITVFYPELNKTPHNYVGIWASIYNITVNYDGLINMREFDLIVVNTQEQGLVQRLRVFNIPIIEINHYAAGVATLSASASASATEITVNPFRQLPTGRQFVLPVSPGLANILTATRRQIPAGKNILIIGNSFMNMPAYLFKQLSNILAAAGWSLTAILYNYNDVSEYLTDHVTFKYNCLAIDLFKELDAARFILFYPATHHFFNLLSGSIVLSLLFGRPLLTIPDVLEHYTLKCHYRINDNSFLVKLLDDVYYRTAQEQLEVRLNEFIVDGRHILDSVVEKIVANRVAPPNS